MDSQRLGHVLTTMVATALIAILAATITTGTIVIAGGAPAFDWQFTLSDRHMLVIHTGPVPTCAFIPNPPQHDCFRPGPDHREFSMAYFTPDSVRSLIQFRLPKP